MKKKDLQEALEIVKPGLANKEMIEQTTSFAFMKGRVVTYNDDISISHPIEGLEIEGAIHAEELYKLLGKVKKEEVEINIQKNEIIIQSGRTKVGLTLQQEITLPLEEIGEQGKWKKLPKDFTKCVKRAMTCCSPDMSKPVLTAVHVNENGSIEGSDDFRFIKCELEEGMPVKTFLIPAMSAAQLTKLEPTKIAEGTGWIHFQTDTGTIMSCRIFEDEFPDITPFLEMEGIDINLPRTINSILDRASVFSKREYFLDEQIVITLKNNRLKVESKSESGWFEEEANLKYEDDPVSFYITPYLLKDILLETLTCTLCEDRLKFEGNGWIYISILRERIK